MVAYSGPQVAVFLLDENDLEDADNVVVKKTVMPSRVKATKFIEQSWDQCFVVFVCEDTSVHKWAIQQTDVNAFTFE